MRDSVREAFLRFTDRFEGTCVWMYLDIKGLVTTGVGNLIDSEDLDIDAPGLATVLPWEWKGGEGATDEEVRAEWGRVKSMQSLRMAGGVAFARVTSLRLSKDAIKDLVHAKLQTNDGIMRNRFRDWEEWPADAQLAILSLCWAMGPLFNFPKMVAALASGDFATAADEIGMRCDPDNPKSPYYNPGLVPRNAANKLLMRNAHRVVADGLGCEVLYWPKDLGESTA